jgi:serine/threonine protein kinase
MTAPKHRADQPAREGQDKVPAQPPAPPAGDGPTTADYSPRPSESGPPAAEPTPAPPRPVVAGYEIVGELGRGGMGVVYKARQRDPKRLVALKMILVGEHAGAEEVARFRTEAEAVARLQHPNIVQVYAIGEAAGRPYLALEFVDGGSLAEQLRGRRWPCRKAARLVETLARAMHHAHWRGIIHRDLKPSNVLLTREGTPKITDFGLAKRLDASVGQTPSNAVLGTPSYMAPEQAGGQSKRVGPAADVYALGVILYELLTGQPPFKAETPLNTIMQVVGQEPVAPRRLRPKVPANLETICLKCLRKEPAERYATAQELAADLRRYLKEEPVVARPTSTWGGAFKWIRDNPAGAILIAVVLILFLLSLAQFLWLR